MMLSTSIYCVLSGVQNSPEKTKNLGKIPYFFLNLPQIMSQQSFNPSCKDWKRFQENTFLKKSVHVKFLKTGL